MRASLIALFLLAASLALAERNPIKPSDFKPLTELPWEKSDASLEEVLEAIYLEPNMAIRYPVLAEYLRVIPGSQLETAFDRCIALEGFQTPSQLVELFLAIWAGRDPDSCWRLTQKLFHVVGIEGGWLAYDSWNARDKITVQDLEAIRTSTFWLDSSALASFPLGVDRSEVPVEERVRLMKEFIETWLAAFHSWPGDLWSHYDFDARSLMYVFRASDSELKGFINQSHYLYDKAAVELALRRWLKTKPSAAIDVLQVGREMKWTTHNGTSPEPWRPPPELLMLWADADLPATVRWAKELDPHNPGAAEAKGFLMGRVGETTRESWLSEARKEDAGKDAENDAVKSLLGGWAQWDPHPALEAALATNDFDAIVRVATDAAYGPFPGHPHNTTHFGLGVIKEFDVAKIPAEIRMSILRDGGWEAIMEQWGDIDIGETARYGMDVILRTDYVPRDGLIRFLSGEDVYPDEGGVLDRTFCALRVWAVVRPEEMKAWIATLKDTEMQKALTWLLDHPWGGKLEQ